MTNGIPNAYSLSNNTAGIGYVTDAGVAVGAYRNSYGFPTAYAGYQQKLPITGFSVLLAGATGYKRQTGYTVSPFVAIDWTTKLYGATSLHVTAIPALNNQMSSVVHFSVGYKFD